MSARFNWRLLRDTTQENYDNRAWRAELTLLVQEDPEVREAGRRVFQNNLLAACWILGWCRVDEEIHREAIAFFSDVDPSLPIDQQHLGRKRRGSLLLPRGVYKSTISMANCVRMLTIWPATIAIMIMCGAKDLAFAFVDQVASFFLKHPLRPPTLFQALFPELCVEKQSAGGEFTTAIRQKEPEIVEPAIWGSSVESSTSGWHPNMLVVDDVSTNRNSKNYESRKRITTQYKLSRKVLLPFGLEHKVGTIYGAGDVYTDELLTSRPGTYRRVIKPALRLKSGERLDANGFPDEEDVELLFPSILSYEYLREEYESGFESFATQYMLDEYGANEVVFGAEQVLAAMRDDNEMPMEGTIYIHWRFPCRTHKWQAAAASVCLIHAGRCYIIDVLYGVHKPSVLATLVHNLARKHGKHRVSVEDTPGARIMQPAIENYCLTTGWDVAITWTPFEMDMGERDTRIRSLETLLSTQRIVFSANLKEMKPLMTQFTQYGMIDETAIPDVVSRCADNLPVILTNDEETEDTSAWKQMMERDRYNMLYGKGQYAPVEPEPEAVVYEEPGVEDQTVTSSGLEITIPGLEY
jgi:hypothetical protein